jgi:hypothetical protein
MNYTELKQPAGMNDKTSKFVVHKTVTVDNFSRPVLQIAWFCQSVRLVNMTAVFFRGQNNKFGIGYSLTTVPLRYCGSIRNSGKRYYLMLLNSVTVQLKCDGTW